MLALVLALLAGLGVLTMFLALASPQPVVTVAGGRPSQPQRRIAVVEKMPFVQSFVYGLVTGLLGFFIPRNKQGEMTSANVRYRQMLKQADWYWAPGEIAPPTPSAPFWNLETLWGTKIVYSLIGAVAGGLVMLWAAGLLGKPLYLVLPGVFLGGFVGWLLPDTKLEGAVKKRQHLLTVEMGYRIPELAAYVRAGNSVIRAFRHLADRPGGPFIAEIRRVLAVYDATTSLSVALEQMVERNQMRATSEFGQQVLMVEKEGGSLGPALDVLSESAQDNLRCRLKEQAESNANAMTLPVKGGLSLVIFMLVGSPALYIVLQSL